MSTMSATLIAKAVEDKISAYRRQFDTIFGDIVEFLVSEDEKDQELGPAASWLRGALEYNANDGKKSRGMMVIMCLDYLKGGKVSEEEAIKALTLGWCVELLQALFLVADDVMDQSEMRRGKPCWYKKCGLVAVNDTFLMEACIYKLLKKHFAEAPYYVSLVNAFHDITYLTAMGQELDMLVYDPSSELDLSKYTMKKYKAIVKYKTAFYSFYLPISLGMHMAGITDQKMFDKARNVLMELGEFFQIQDDYLDCYGNPEIMGKIGTDIQDAKCSWLMVTALEKASEEQRNILKIHYGKTNEESISKVKQLFNELELEKEFKSYEEKSRERIIDLIEVNSNGLPKGLFIELVKKIYKREK